VSRYAGIVKYVQECLDLLNLMRVNRMSNSEEEETGVRRAEDMVKKIMEIIKEDEQGSSSDEEAPSSREATPPQRMDKMQIDDGENRHSDVGEQGPAVESSYGDETVIFDSEVDGVDGQDISPIQSSKTL
jgi:hypothetical protein